MERKSVESLFAHAGTINALVIGDLMLDQYLWGKAERISPEAPVQVVDVTREEIPDRRGRQRGQQPGGPRLPGERGERGGGGTRTAPFSSMPFPARGST